MDKDETTISLKRKSNPVETLFDSDDDEPIGTFLKLKGKKNSKKIEVIEDVGVNKVEEVERSGVEDMELGMEDTLANFKKKLKGPKKDYGSASVEERGMRSTEGEYSGDVIVIKGLKVKAKMKNKRIKIDSDTNLFVRESEYDNGFVHFGSENDELQHQEKVIPEYGDEALEDSLSSFSQKLQSSLILKSRGSSRPKQGNENQARNSPSSLKACSTKTTEVQDCEIDSEVPGPQQGSTDDTPSSGNIRGSHYVHHEETKGTPQLPLQKPIVHREYDNDDREDHLDPQLNLTAVTVVPPINQMIRSSVLEEDPKFNLQNRLLNKNCCHTSLSNGSETGVLHRDNLFGDRNSPNRIIDKCFRERGLVSVSAHEEDDQALEHMSSSVAACEELKNELAFKVKHENESQKALESSHMLHEDAYPPNCDYPSENEAVNVISDQGSSPEDRVSPDDPETNEIRLSVLHRSARNAKKSRHVDMAYEGDADWEVLMQSQEFFVSQQSDKTREKFNSSSMAVDAENGKAAAVSAGLRARAVGPIEKIKFKEVLKRKGGLQEYLECRNYILSVWNKDVSRILPLSDFGVSGVHFLGESPQASLIRDIYVFLDQCGYINFGVPCEKEKVENCTKHDLELLTDKLGENPGLQIVDSEYGVAHSLGEEKSSETCTRGDNDDIFANTIQAGKLKTEDEFINLKASESSVRSGPQGCAPDDSQLINSIDPLLVKEVAHADVVSAVPSKPSQGFCEIMSSPMNCAYTHRQDSLVPKKSLIIIGAGPAGLTAARHLQRQGFGVTVLEARSRIGGRVFTDRSSLSVPVDLGASIITGIEADVDTERRPDPSSLICAQLGLELTVLNSDCPLYDTVTAQKVPADLDEALEAEFNSLLDDMVPLIAEKGERALKMSLEEGLENALTRRRFSCYRSDDTAVAAENFTLDNVTSNGQSTETKGLSPLERRVMDWHFAHLEYGCATLLKDVSLPNWNQDDEYGGFGGAHCMIKGGYSAVVESLGEGIHVHLDHIVTDIAYSTKNCGTGDDLHNKVKVSTSNGREFSGDAVLVTVPLGCLKAETIKFSPPLPQWKYSSIKKLGFGVLNKVVLEFPEVFWDVTIDYFGATAEGTDQRGRCFMFWNVRKTVGAPVLIALVVGKAAIDDQYTSSSEHVSHALLILRKLFGEDKVSEPVASVVTDWGKDPYSFGAYSYVAVGSSGEDYDVLGRPVENCVFFAGEATCKEHPDTVGGAMMSGLREAVRIIDILNTGTDYAAEVEAMEAARRNSNIEKSEVKDLIRRLDAIKFSSVVSKESLNGSRISNWRSMLKEMFFTAKTTSGRLHLAKELLNLPVGFLKTFASTREGLSTLNSWILDSMGKDGTQLLRHCLRLLVLVSNDLLAVRLSGVGKTVKDKACVHTSRDIRAIASQLVNVWVELFRKKKAAKGGFKPLKHSTDVVSKSKSSIAHGRPPLRTHVVPDSKEASKLSAFAGHRYPYNSSTKKVVENHVKGETRVDPKSDVQQLNSHDILEDENHEIPMSEEEKAAIAAAEAARSAAIAAAKAYASFDAMHKASPQLPKILSFQRFATREQHAHMDEYDSRKKWPGVAVGRQDCLSEIDSRNCRVRDWSVDFSAAGVNLENSKISADNRSQRSHSNEVGSQMNFREHSGESAAVESSMLTKAWVDSSGSMGLKDYNAIERWQCQAAAASSGFSHGTMHVADEEDSNMSSELNKRKHDDAPANETSASQVTINKELKGNQSRGAESIKHSVVDYVASLLMPLYKARKIDRESYKSIMKKTATKVMEQTTDVEKTMAISEFLDFRRKNKIRAFVDMLIERNMAMKPDAKTGTSKK